MMSAMKQHARARGPRRHRGVLRDRRRQVLHRPDPRRRRRPACRPEHPRHSLSLAGARSYRSFLPACGSGRVVSGALDGGRDPRRSLALAPTARSFPRVARVASCRGRFDGGRDPRRSLALAPTARSFPRVARVASCRGRLPCACSSQSSAPASRSRSCSAGERPRRCRAPSPGPGRASGRPGRSRSARRRAGSRCARRGRRRGTGG